MPHAIRVTGTAIREGLEGSVRLGADYGRLRKSLSKCNNYKQLSPRSAIGTSCFDGMNISDFQFYKIKVFGTGRRR
jgi:hypothetical protein